MTDMKHHGVVSERRPMFDTTLPTCGLHSHQLLVCPGCSQPTALAVSTGRDSPDWGPSISAASSFVPCQAKYFRKSIFAGKGRRSERLKPIDSFDRFSDADFNANRE